MRKKVMVFYFGLLFISMTYITQQYSDLQVPIHFPKPVYNFERNPLIPEKVELGRHLFYDPILSRDQTISCATCHSPFNAFAHTDHDLSHGIDDQVGLRNAPPLYNLAWQKSFMWDGAINHLDMQALVPINDPKEMGEDIGRVVQKLQQNPAYPSRFYQAFKDSTITGEHLLKAISQFQLTLISATSKYDKVQEGRATFTEQEAKGYQIFKKHCNSCHQEPLFSTYQFADNGLAVDTTLNDFGKYRITKNLSDSLLFKIPSLRNISFTSPYMHDGRFRKLRQVVTHYTENIVQRPSLTGDLQNPINLTPFEKTDLVAFLLTLDDKDFIFDKKHLFPISNK